jgi:hypothetical protein
MSTPRLVWTSPGAVAAIIVCDYTVQTVSYCIFLSKMLSKMLSNTCCGGRKAHRTRLDQFFFQGLPWNHRRVSDVRHCLACALHDDVQLPPRPAKGRRTILCYSTCYNSILYILFYLVLTLCSILFRPVPSCFSLFHGFIIFSWKLAPRSLRCGPRQWKLHWHQRIWRGGWACAEYYRNW